MKKLLLIILWFVLIWFSFAFRIDELLEEEIEKNNNLVYQIEQFDERFDNLKVKGDLSSQLTEKFSSYYTFAESISNIWYYIDTYNSQIQQYISQPEYDEEIYDQSLSYVKTDLYNRMTQQNSFLNSQVEIWEDILELIEWNANIVDVSIIYDSIKQNYWEKNYLIIKSLEPQVEKIMEKLEAKNLSKENVEKLQEKLEVKKQSSNNNTLKALIDFLNFNLDYIDAK